MFLTVFNTISPLFFVITLGYILYRKKFINKEMQNGLNKISYWIGLPAFLFYKVTFAKLAFDSVKNLFLCMILATIICMALSYLVCRLFKQAKPTRGASIQLAGRGNLAYISLPIIIYLAAKSFPDKALEITDMVILTLTPVVLIYNIICVIALSSHSEIITNNLKRNIIQQLYTNPLIISSVLGLCVNLSGYQFNQNSAIFRTCDVLGQSAFPMALLAIGSQMAQISLRGNIRWIIFFSSIKTILAPAIGFLLCRFMGMGTIETLSVMLLLASPTAIASYVLAEELNCAPDLTAGTIVLSTIFSFFSILTILILSQFNLI